VTQVSTMPLRGASAQRTALLRALGIVGAICLAVEFIYTVIDTIAASPLIHAQSDVVMHTVNIFLFLRILFGPVLFAVLTVCGVVAARRTWQGRPRRNLFAGIFAALLMMLVLIGPRLVHVASGTYYAWGNATLHILANAFILLAAAIYLGATLLTPSNRPTEEGYEGE
jgi:hypothetical protein